MAAALQVVMHPRLGADKYGNPHAPLFAKQSQLLKIAAQVKKHYFLANPPPRSWNVFSFESADATDNNLETTIHRHTQQKYVCSTIVRGRSLVKPREVHMTPVLCTFATNATTTTTNCYRD